MGILLTTNKKKSSYDNKSYSIAYIEEADSNVVSLTSAHDSFWDKMIANQKLDDVVWAVCANAISEELATALLYIDRESAKDLVRNFTRAAKKFELFEAYESIKSADSLEEKLTIVVLEQLISFRSDSKTDGIEEAYLFHSEMIERLKKALYKIPYKKLKELQSQILKLVAA